MIAWLALGFSLLATVCAAISLYLDVHTRHHSREVHRYVRDIRRHLPRNGDPK